MPTYGLIDPDYRMRLRQGPEHGDGPFFVLTLAKYRPGSEPGPVRSPDPDDQYYPVRLLTAVGASIRFVASVVAGSGDWDRVGVISYPTRRSFIEMGERHDARDWHARREPKLERMTVVGMIPTGALPASDPSRRVLLEMWNGPEPAPLIDGPATTFVVEGTYIGDGRRWSGARYTAIEPGTALPLQRAMFAYQAVLLQPTIDRWQ